MPGITPTTELGGSIASRGRHVCGLFHSGDEDHKVLSPLIINSLLRERAPTPQPA
jgi:hypothetical protein